MKLVTFQQQSPQSHRDLQLQLQSPQSHRDLQVQLQSPKSHRDLQLASFRAPSPTGTSNWPQSHRDLQLARNISKASASEPSVPQGPPTGPVPQGPRNGPSPTGTSNWPQSHMDLQLAPVPHGPPTGQKH